MFMCQYYRRFVFDRTLYLMLSALLLLIALPARPAQAATIVYVKSGGTGNGSSWANPADLQVALTNAVASDEPRVAKDTNQPYIRSNAQTSIKLKNVVAIHGGFADGETERSQSSITPSATILSGDLLSNDSAAISTRNPTHAHNS